MEQLQIIGFFIVVAVVACVGYTAINLISWFFSLFGGVCVGC